MRKWEDENVRKGDREIVKSFPGGKKYRTGAKKMKHKKAAGD